LLKDVTNTSEKLPTGLIIFATPLGGKEFARPQKEVEGNGSQPYFHGAPHLTAGKTNQLHLGF